VDIITERKLLLSRAPARQEEEESMQQPGIGTYLQEDHTAISWDLPVPRSALAIGAHPDDIEFGCGGTLAKWAKEGCQVSTVIFTDGSKGSWIPGDDPQALAERREIEARTAASTLTGSTDLTFLRAVDGELRRTQSIFEAVVSAIRRTQCEVILAHDPWKRYRLHPDHREAGWISLDAIVAARDPLYLPDIHLAAHRPTTALLWEADLVDHYETIDSSFESKFASLLCHTSQLGTTMGIADPNSPDEIGAFRERLTATHRSIGERTGGGLAEEFKVLTSL
jgi:LmbE family N-acetylglucosaminyl deacetylase